MPCALILAVVMLAEPQAKPSADLGPRSLTGMVREKGTDRRPANAAIWLTEAATPVEIPQTGMSLRGSGPFNPNRYIPAVLAQGRADDRGRFTIDFPVSAQRRNPVAPLALWAVSADGDGKRTLALQRFFPPGVHDDESIMLELEKPPAVEIIIKSPDGRLMPGTRVAPECYRDVMLPDALANSLATITDADGRAQLQGFAADGLRSVRVEGKGFGVQIHGLLHPDGSTNLISLTLAPVARIVGRFTLPNDETQPLHGITVHAVTQVGGYLGSGVTGVADIECDPRGQFEVPAIAAGLLEITTRFDPKMGTTLRGEGPSKTTIVPNQSAEFAISLHKTVRIEGVVRERGNGRPIAGALVHLNDRDGGGGLAATDEQGCYVGFVVQTAPQPYGWVVSRPQPFFWPSSNPTSSQSMPKADVKVWTLPPAELIRGVDVHGQVVDAAGRSVPYARVDAGESTRCDAQGRFTLSGVDPLVDIEISAWTNHAETKAPAVIRAGNEPIRLTISPQNTILLTGQVLDPAGHAIAGAEVRIWRITRTNFRMLRGQIIKRAPITSEDGGAVVFTDAEGRFQSPRRIIPGGEITIQAVAPGRLANHRGPIAITPGDTLPRTRELPVIVLRGVRSIEGAVVDSRNQAIADAIVHQAGDGPMRTWTTTDRTGRFTLPGLTEGPGFIVAQKAGYRSMLRAVDDQHSPVHVMLATKNEQILIKPRRTSSVAREERQALARRLFAPIVRELAAKGSQQDRAEFFFKWADIDPTAALEHFGAQGITDPDLHSASLKNLAEGLAKHDALDEATALLETCPDPGTRARGYLALGNDHRPSRLNPRARELLEQAFLNAKAIKSPIDRLSLMALIAEGWLNLGAVDQARIVHDAVRELQKEISPSNATLRMRVISAARLARLDLPAALGAVEEVRNASTKSQTRARADLVAQAYELIAYRVAEQSPQDAERILKQISSRIERLPIGYRVAYRMAAKDLDRARRIVAAEPPDNAGQRAYVLGLMAQAVAPSDHGSAIHLLDEAFIELERLVALNPTDRPIDHAAGLIDIVAQVQPERLDELFALACALRLPFGESLQDSDRGRSAISAVSMAMNVALQDADLASRILAPWIAMIPEFGQTRGSSAVAGVILAALALTDPRKAVTMIENLPDDPADFSGLQSPKNQARLLAASLFVRDHADQVEFINRYFVSRWSPNGIN